MTDNKIRTSELVEEHERERRQADRSDDNRNSVHSTRFPANAVQAYTAVKIIKASKMPKIQ